MAIRGTAHGLRNRAILTVVAQMGLRAGDIAALTLDAIDWEARTSWRSVGAAALAADRAVPAVR